MITVLSSAWLTIRRRTLLVPAFSAVTVFAILLVYGTFLSAGRPGGSRLSDPPLTLTDLAGEATLARLAGGVVMVVGAVVFSVSAAHAAAPFASGSIRVQLVRQPRRHLWFLGQLGAMWLLTVALTVTAVLAVTAASYGAAAAYHVPTGAWSSPAALSQLGVTTINLAGCLLGFAVAGTTLALVLRSAIAAIGFGLVYGLLEGLIGSALPPVARFLPSQNLAALAQGGTHTIGHGWAIGASAALVAALITISLAVIRRRDVTD